MPLLQLRNLLFIVNLSALILFVAMDAQASARSLPPPPLEPPPYSAPPVRIQTLPLPAVRQKKRIESIDTAPLALQASNGLLSADLVGSSCAPGPLKSPNSNGSAAASQLERLRAAASGTTSFENQQLSMARQQRLQANAAWQMGLLTLHGICLVLNTADAEVWFVRAQQLGEPLAAAGLAWCEIEGCKAAPNPASAGKWIELLRNVDAPRALYLQWLMQSRLAPLELAPPGLGSAGKRYTALHDRQLLASAAQLGDINAKIELGLDSVFSNQLAEALVFFKSASPKSAAAAVNAAVMVERLKNEAKLISAPPSAATSAAPTAAPSAAPFAAPSPARASSAVNVKLLSAAENLAQAQRYHRGTGVPSNYTEAIRLYQLAQNQGSVTAKKMLELIFSRPSPDGQIDLAWMQQLARVDLSGAAPSIDNNSAKQSLKREPTPLFELVPQPWKRYAAAAISA